MHLCQKEIFAWVNADSRHVQLISVTLNRTAHALCLKEIFAWVNADSRHVQLISASLNRTDHAFMSKGNFGMGE